MTFTNFLTFYEMYQKRERTKGEAETADLADSLGVKGREVVSLVGAGGKTTLMFRLGKELSRLKKRVVITTTTKILEPSPEETPFLLINSDEEQLKRAVLREIRERQEMTIAAERLGSGKLKGVSCSLVDTLWTSEEIDHILVEADGASGRPIKAPREWEPVIPSSSGLVVAILGMDGLEKPLDDRYVFQPERVSRITGIPLGERMTDEGMAVLMTHPEGIFKGAPFSSRVTAFLNKVDIPEGLSKARRVAQKIVEKRHPRIERVVLGAMKKEPCIAEVIFP
jgi:probable selenium-dependent hydroxylase accessory protein YqeC